MSKWIQVTSIEIRGASLFLQYEDYSKRVCSIELRYDREIADPLAPYPKASIERLLNYIAISQCVYLFNCDYYDEIIAYYELTSAEQAFFEQLFLSGMAEFRYVNNLPTQAMTTIHGRHGISTFEQSKILPTHSGAIVMNGGGKDGAVAAEAMHATGQPLTWFTLHMDGPRADIIRASASHEYITSRRYIEKSDVQQYHGHKPLNAELGLQALLAALITGRKYIVAGNEYSANEPNMTIDGFDINHQYTKSYQFERDLADLIEQLTLGISYFSVLRPLYELQIIRIFDDFPQYHQLFISCNEGVRHGFWCLACDKCAFLTLAISALNPELVEKIWHDKQVISKKELRTSLIALVSPDSPKPFDCVGTIEECQLALGLLALNTTFWDTLPIDFREKLQPFIRQI